MPGGRRRLRASFRRFGKGGVDVTVRGKRQPKTIGDLVPDPENRRKHNPRNIGMVVDALQRVGAARSIVIDENDVVLAGNGVLEAAAEAGITRLRVVDVDGSEVVAVRRSGLTKEQKRDLAISDNRAGELAEWNAEQLRADRDAGLGLSPWFGDHELSRALDERDNPAEHWRGMPQFEHEDKTAWKQVIVNFRCKADLEEFSRLLNQTMTEKTRSVWHPKAEIERYADKAYTDQ
jgi:hypothetical protein